MIPSECLPGSLVDYVLSLLLRASRTRLALRGRWDSEPCHAERQTISPEPGSVRVTSRPFGNLILYTCRLTFGIG